MITITEQIPNKLPGLSSFRVEFPYNADIVSAVKECGNAVWDAKNKIWEVGMPYLGRLLDKVCDLDDIQLNLLPDSYATKPEDIVLDKHKTTPFSYQEEGIKFGLANERYLLLDAPGLGKTLQMIYVAEERHKREGLEHCLIVCGINTLKANWRKEIGIHSDLSCKILGEKVNKKGKLTYGGVQERINDLKNPINEFFVITNVESIRSEEVVKLINDGPNKFDMIILDECHRCFTGDTLITTEDGQLPIKDIVSDYKNHKVLSYNENTGLKEYKEIDSTSISTTEELLELVIEEEGIATKLYCTPDHLVFTQNRGYVPAIDLDSSDILIFNKS